MKDNVLEEMRMSNVVKMTIVFKEPIADKV